jgi:hypothetical protein
MRGVQRLAVNGSFELKMLLLGEKAEKGGSRFVHEGNGEECPKKVGSNPRPNSRSKKTKPGKSPAVAIYQPIFPLLETPKKHPN